MRRLTFHSEYIDTLDLFFRESISDLKSLGCEVDVSSIAGFSYFSSTSEPSFINSRYLPFLPSLVRRCLQAFFYLLEFTSRSPDNVSVLVTPTLIIVAPFVSLFRNFNYIIISQGQLEAEGLLTSYIYRLLLLFSVLRATCSYSCNLMEKFRWDFYPYHLLKRKLKILPWYGVCLSRSKINLYKNALVHSSPTHKINKFCYLGRISDSKGCTDLIRLFSHSLFSRFSLTLAGPIECDPSILGLISNLPSNITLQDSIPSNDIPDWLSGFDILITFSRGESIGSATLEALMCGKPVISLLNSGSCQVLRHSVDSFLLDDVDPSSVLSAIDYCQKNYTSMSSAASSLCSLVLPRPSYLSSSIFNFLARCI